MVPAKAAVPNFIDCPTDSRGPASRIYVIFTDTASTRAALLAATRLARGLDLPIELLRVQVVPYPLPLNEPPVSTDFVERAMCRLVADLEAEISVRILLCREPNEPLRNAIGPDGLVVIGQGARKLERLLRSDGRRLILIH